jgi:hypothetical protein
MTLDHKMHERFYTRKEFELAAQVRFQADRLQTLAESLARVSQEALMKAGADTAPTIEKKPALTVTQLEILNNRSTVPYIAILFYGHGGEPAEIQEIRGTLKAIEMSLRSTSEMLFGYMEKHFAGEHSLLIRPKEEWLEAAIWRSRLTTSLYCVAGYFRMAAEMIAVAFTVLNKAKLAGAALLSEENRRETVLLLNATSTFLHDAARYLGLAGIELGCDEDRWRRLEVALKAILDGDKDDEEEGLEDVKK